MNKRFSDNKKSLLYSFNLRITLQIWEKITRVFVKLWTGHKPRHGQGDKVGFCSKSSAVPNKHDSTWTDFCLVYFFKFDKLRLHVELISISEHQHDFKFSWSWSTDIYILSTYRMVGIFQMFRKLSIDGIKGWQRKLLY